MDLANISARRTDSSAFSRIVAVYRLVHILLKVCLGDEMVVAEDHPFEMSPETFNGIGGDFVLGEFFLAVVDNSVLIAFLGKPCVRRQFVREDIGLISNELLDNRHKGSRLRVWHDDGPCFALSCYHTEYGSLRLGTPTLSFLCLLGFVLVGLPATEIHFVYLHLAFKGRSIILIEEGANLMEDVPRSFLRHFYIPCELVGGYAFLMAADKVHSHKQFLQWQFGVLKNGSDKTRETLVAVGTLELIVTVTALIDMGAAAMRADNHLTPTPLGDKVTATLVAIEMVGEGYEGIKVLKCKSHSSRYFYIFIP